MVFHKEAGGVASSFHENDNSKSKRKRGMSENEVTATLLARGVSIFRADNRLRTAAIPSRPAVGSSR